MNLRNRKRIASSIFKTGKGRVWMDPTRLKDFKDAITKDDLRKLSMQGALLIKQKKGVSRFWARHTIKQKRKGARKGVGSRKGRQTARSGKKILWVNKIRAQREEMTEYLNKNLITQEIYAQLRKKAKGGFFRSTRHIKLYLTEHNLWNKK
ncbi:50S ribosomal protein L19e [Candidatus Woesearchaeota archaeon]|nr:MAG: large subunit ribosomal protein L19e [archaeon GW2011_AR18]MBS3161193.1 50S ribosomal protein L19e [Candidatus Woesearchaeota archaeon]HIH25994.1 50S ribosomal protein L19e [Nanoarchaeota archaeon]